MLAMERQNKILNILDLDGGVKSSNLTNILNVSLETIRRDIDVLEKKGLLKKVHGGAVQNRKKNLDLPHKLRVNKMQEEKKEIAFKAIKYIKENDVIAINGSTTNLELAKLIKTKEYKLTIITNSLLIANELSNLKNIRLIMIGGIYESIEFSFLGDTSVKQILNFSANKCFISAGGVSPKRSITDFTEKDVSISKAFMEISEEIIILADSSKIGNNALIKICDIRDASLIISDSNIKKNTREEFQNINININ